MLRFRGLAPVRVAQLLLPVLRPPSRASRCALERSAGVMRLATMSRPLCAPRGRANWTLEGQLIESPIEYVDLGSAFVVGNWSSMRSTTASRASWGAIVERQATYGPEKGDAAQIIADHRCRLRCAESKKIILKYYFHQHQRALPRRQVDHDPNTENTEQGRGGGKFLI